MEGRNVAQEEQEGSEGTGFARSFPQFVTIKSYLFVLLHYGL
jgi:hypothetical protein